MKALDAYADVLGAPQRQICEQVAAVATSIGGELMGGTGVAVQLLHRVSVDLDVMTPAPLSGSDLHRALEKEFGSSVEVLNLSSHVCQARVKDVHIDLISEAPGSPFAPDGIDRIGEGSTVCDMPVASIPDLLAAKLSALTQRDTLRDYLDIAAIDDRTPYKLQDGISSYIHRYRLPPNTSMVNVVLRRLTESAAAPVDPLMESLRPSVVAHLDLRVLSLIAPGNHRTFAERGTGKPVIPKTQPKILKPPVISTDSELNTMKRGYRKRCNKLMPLARRRCQRPRGHQGSCR